VALDADTVYVRVTSHNDRAEGAIADAPQRRLSGTPAGEALFTLRPWGG
jgi:hypothetical protein